MKKGKFLMVLAVVLMLTATGVALGIGLDNNNGDAEKNKEEVENKVRYEIIEDKDLVPSEVAGAVENLKTQKGYFVFGQPAFDTGEEVYLLISSGEKPTGGYDITIEKVEAEEDVLKVVVKETEPGKDEMVTQALTYPHVIVSLEDAYETYQVVTAEGKELTNLAEVEIEEPDITYEEGLEPVPNSDPRAGESFIEGEIKEVDLENRKVLIDIHMGPDTPDVDPRIEITEDAQLRQLEGKEETSLSMSDLEEGMIAGMVLTPEGQARAVIIHVYEF